MNSPQNTVSLEALVRKERMRFLKNDSGTGEPDDPQDLCLILGAGSDVPIALLLVDH
jgi:hypothetical protein